MADRKVIAFPKLPAAKVWLPDDLLEQAKDELTHQLFMELGQLYWLYQEAVKAGRFGRASEFRSEIELLLAERR